MKTSLISFVTLVGILSSSSAFAPTTVGGRHRPQLDAVTAPDVVVISPPGGIGEITSMEAARLGGKVRWFVVSAPSNNQSSKSTLALSADTLASIHKAGGSIELAGSDSESLLSASETNDATLALAEWCRGTKSVICTYDGSEEEQSRADLTMMPEDRDNGTTDRLIRGGIRVAARQAVEVAASGATQIVALYSGEEMVNVREADESKGGFLKALFGGKANQIPETFADAMNGPIHIVRYGELFGAPESSPDSSPFLGGPRCEPIVRDMYTMRSIRIDPTISVSGNILSGGSKSNRLAVGGALTRLGLEKIIIPSNGGIDVALSSFPGTDAPTEENWSSEFDRALRMISSPSGGAILFSYEFSKVPSTNRLAEWIATKWAPAILRSYDIAGIRVGARPVYATHSNNIVEVVWQELVDFTSVTSGKMIIEVNENGLTASRGAGDASTGFGSISMKPLPGEDILVRKLADAAAQAVEKGLALKSIEKVIQENDQTVVSDPPPVSVVSMDEEAPSAIQSDSGPRSSGVRRSSGKTRGKRTTTSSTEEEFE